jgi:hypothetical protein
VMDVPTRLSILHCALISGTFGRGKVLLRSPEMH